MARASNWQKRRASSNSTPQCMQPRFRAANTSRSKVTPIGSAASGGTRPVCNIRRAPAKWDRPAIRRLSSMPSCRCTASADCASSMRPSCRQSWPVTRMQRSTWSVRRRPIWWRTTGCPDQVAVPFRVIITFSYCWLLEQGIVMYSVRKSVYSFIFILIVIYFSMFINLLKNDLLFYYHTRQILKVRPANSHTSRPCNILRLHDFLVGIIQKWIRGWIERIPLLPVYVLVLKDRHLYRRQPSIRRYGL